MPGGQAADEVAHGHDLRSASPVRHACDAGVREHDAVADGDDHGPRAGHSVGREDFNHRVGAGGVERDVERELLLGLAGGEIGLRQPVSGRHAGREIERVFD